MPNKSPCMLHKPSCDHVHYRAIQITVSQFLENHVMLLQASWPWSWPWFIPYPTGHIGPHSDAIRVCQELSPLLLPRWTPSFVGLCWLCSSSSLLVHLVLSCILVPASTVLAVVCTCGPYGKHVQASEVVFLSVCCPWFVASIMPNCNCEFAAILRYTSEMVQANTKVTIKCEYEVLSRSVKWCHF